MDWSDVYITAQQMAEEKVGELKIPMDERLLINTWVREAISKKSKPDPKVIYLATYDQLPPAAFGQPETIWETIEASRRIQGKAPLSEQEEKQIKFLSGVTGMLCSEAAASGKLSTSEPKRGCASLFVISGILAASTHALVRFMD